MVSDTTYPAKNDYIWGMNDPLTSLGNVPITAQTILSLYPDIKDGAQKIGQMEREGAIIRLKRGIYVVSSGITGQVVSEGLVANHLCSPSYLSLTSALRYYGLIPEAVYEVQSMTLKRSRSVTNTLGHFTYTHIDPVAYPIGLRSTREAGVGFWLASPEKALCDLIASTPGLNLRFMDQAECYLEEDIRLDMDAFQAMDQSILEEYARVGKKSGSVNTILRLLKK